MDIRFATPDNTSEIKNIWQYSFQDPENFTRWFFDEIYKSENTLAAYDENKPVAALQLFPKTISIEGKPYNAAYIAGVSVLPEYRSKGISGRLLVEANEIMRRQDYDIALLIPFNFSFYRKFGYNCMSYLSEYRGNMDALRQYANLGGSFTPYEKPPVVIYKKFVKNKNAFIVRNGAEFDEIYKNNYLSKGYFYILNEGGYLIYTIENDTLNVSEIAYTNLKNLQTILGFIHSHSSQVAKFSIKTASDGYLRMVLCEKGVDEIRYPHVMAKLLNKAIAAPGDGINQNNYINMLGWV